MATKSPLAFGVERLRQIVQQAWVGWQDWPMRGKSVEEYVIHGLHDLQLLRCNCERLSRTALGRRARHRMLATACWHFPIYSQTFVYQELTQLIQHGFDVRFLYSALNPRAYLPAQFSRLWHARRQLFLHPSVCQRDYAYFAQRMPEKIDRLVDMVCQASGMSPRELRDHYHFLQAFAFTRLVEAYRPDYLHSYFFYEGTLFTLFASYLLDIPRGVSCYADHMLQDYPLKMVALHLQQCQLVIATSHLGCLNRLLSVDRFLDSRGQSRLFSAWWGSIFKASASSQAGQPRPRALFVTV